MEKKPFSESEMVTKIEEGGNPARTIFDVPCTLRENLLQGLKTNDYQYLANVRDMHGINTALIADNVARGMVSIDGVRQIPSPEGEQDVFGVTWIWEPNVRGSMVKPGEPFLKDIEDWEEVIKFPNPDEWDWANEPEKYADILADRMYAVKSTIFTGYFERLISFMDFENAAIAMIDEDQQEYVTALFERLTDLYISYVDHFKESFDIDVLEVHDDWGSQRAPLLSEETIRTMILPHLKRLVDHTHSLGIYFELHSCGKIEDLVPVMIDAGVDMWFGQEVNDKKKVLDLYGDKIMVEVEVPELGLDATDEEIEAAAEAWVEDFIIPGKPVALSIYSSARVNRPYMTDALYRLSRKKLCGEE